MVRFFVTPGSISGGKIEVSGENFHYLKNVLRVRKGESIIAFDGTGNDYLCSLDDINPLCMTLGIKHTFDSRTEASVEIHLAQSLIKMKNFELCIQKCTELGVKRFTPVITERTVIKLEEGKKENRRCRWEKIAAEAAKQCGRSVSPDVRSVVDFKDVLGEMKDFDLGIIPWEEEESLSLRRVLRDSGSNHPGKVMVLIGPEGGLTREEVSSAKSAGMVSVSLGPRLLRSETAAIATVAVLIHELEEAGRTPFSKVGE